ncbi:sigma-70 family RNA polymerase sigma factor [Acidovorax sp.]|uniref:sigma-70 family RNA polymerase sigma factor n=1 Tax=Acidovorax sp. TaxID=1872122 RepID=UPI0026253A32|nr:sigma-70 family RNA polymerase sigma factor [Acidovorax sp.]
MAEGEQQSAEDLGAVFSRLQRSLRSYLRRRVSDAAQVEDLLQEVFVKALASKRAGRQINNMTGWIFAAARTTLVDYFRATGHPTQEIDENTPDINDSEDLQLHAEVASCLRVLLAELPAIYQDTLAATDFEGETMRSVAARQAVSVSAIKSRAARGRALLKEKLIACCHVEMTHGLVSDYRRNSPSHCSGTCAQPPSFPRTGVSDR